MFKTRRAFVQALLIVAGAAVIYAPRLHDAPIYLTHDEVFFGLQAHSIATTWRDWNGTLLPLYFHITANVWFHPMVAYVLAVVLKVLPLSESTIRFPTVIVGLIDIALIYGVARRLFKSDALAALAALFLVFTPAHFIHSRVAMDYLYPVPFVIAWFWCLMVFVERRNPWALCAAALFPGVGFYSYLASLVMMPLYMVMTIVVVLTCEKKSHRLHVVAAGAFLLPLLLLMPWMSRHPTMFSDFIGRYNVYPTQYNPLQGLKELANYTSLTERAWLYGEFFNPSYFFFSGGSNIVNATRRAGVFLFPFAVFLPLGIHQILNAKRTTMSLVVLAGFVTAPLAAMLVDEPGAIDRELVLLPFAVLIAVYGFEFLWSLRQTLWRVVAVCLLAIMPLQFYYFASDYFNDYRIRSIDGFERNIRGTFEEAFRLDRPGSTSPVYISTEIPYVDYYWKFYVLKEHKDGLLQRAVYVDAKTLDLAHMPPGSLVISNAGGQVEAALMKSGAVTKLAAIAEPNGAVSFSIFGS